MHCRKRDKNNKKINKHGGKREYIHIHEPHYDRQ